MMGLGYFGNGGGSNLSPLAPPFTVDRSNPKPTSNPSPNPNPNPNPNFTDPPPYTWQYTPHSEIDSIRTTHTTPNDYCYVDSDSNAKFESDSFSVSKRYYRPPYVGSDENMPLVGLNEPRYDLSSSDLVPMEGSSRIDYMQSLVGLEYGQQWGGFWNGLGEGKRARIMEGDGSLCAEEVNLGSSIVYKNYLNQGAGTAENLNKCDEGSSSSHTKYADVFARENRAGPLNTGQWDDNSFLPQSIRLTPIESSKKPILGTGSNHPQSHMQAPSSESATDSWNLQKPYAPYDKRFQLFDSSTNNRVSALVIRPPPVAPVISAPHAVGNISVNNEGVDKYNPLDENSPNSNQLSFFVDRYEKEELPNKCLTKNAFDQTFKANGFSLSVDITEAVKSTTNSSDNLDSPCWKGAPSGKFPQFETCESVIENKLEANNNSNHQETHLFTSYNDLVNSPYQELCQSSIENEKNGFSPSREKNSDDGEVQSSVGIGKPRNEHNLVNESKTESGFKAFQIGQLGFEEERLASERALKSSPKVDVQMLVNAMVNLSELLVFHCSNDDVRALNEQDHESLKLVVGNLDACMSKKIVHATPTQESKSPQQGNTHKLGKLPDLMMGASVGRPQVTNEAAAHYNGEVDYQYMPVKNRNDISGKKVEKFMDFVSLTDDADVSKYHNMVQAIKKVLDENFESEEELQSQTLLYKNLWLEAEAQLCCTSYRSRFDRVKMEMEKCDADKAKDMPESSTAVEKVSGPKISPDPHTNNIPMPKVNDSPKPNPLGRVDNVDASVMARFNIIKSRGDSSHSTNGVEKALEIVDAAFSGKRTRTQIPGNQTENKSFNVAVGPPRSHPYGNEHKPASHVDDSVMARFHIIKSRGDNLNFSNAKEQQLPGVVDAASSGKRNRVLFLGDQMGNNSFESGNEDKFGHHADVSEVETAEDDQVNRQLRSGWYGKSSLDWEYVLKDDEFVWHK